MVGVAVGLGFLTRVLMMRMLMTEEQGSIEPMISLTDLSPATWGLRLGVAAALGLTLVTALRRR